MPPQLLHRAVHLSFSMFPDHNALYSSTLVHSSLGTGHSGANNTLSLLKGRFWWTSMARDVRRFIQGCSDCTISRSPHHLPTGKVHLLPVPNRPWSHLGVDIITDLPPSDGNTFSGCHCSFSNFQSHVICFLSRDSLRLLKLLNFSSIMSSDNSEFHNILCWIVGPN